MNAKYFKRKYQSLKTQLIKEIQKRVLDSLEKYSDKGKLVFMTPIVQSDEITTYYHNINKDFKISGTSAGYPFNNLFDSLDFSELYAILYVLDSGMFYPVEELSSEDIGLMGEIPLFSIFEP